MNTTTLSTIEDRQTLPDWLVVQKGCKPVSKHQAPHGGLPLGFILGMAISVLLAVLLGGQTALKLHREERREIRARQELLTEVIAPLVADIEHISDPSEIAVLLSSVARAETTNGSTRIELALSDDDGKVLVSVPNESIIHSFDEAVSTRLPVSTAALSSGKGTLTIWQHDTWLTTEMNKRKRAAWVEIGVTVLVVAFAIQLIIYFLVTRPLYGLLMTFEKVEQGYPVKHRKTPWGARESQFLEWRFHKMNTCLIKNARLLVDAHKRAMNASRSRQQSGSALQYFDPLDPDRTPRSDSHEIMKRYLLDRCIQLENCDLGDFRIRAIAREILEHDAVEAERLGELALRARAENAALKILDAETFEYVNRELETLVNSRTEWWNRTSATIKSTLISDGITVVAIQHRAKHAAGIWRKMRERNIDIEDVADILAFRIIVPSVDDCYLALDAVHSLFVPAPFRFKDYIVDPKTNGYQSLHTSVHDHDNFVFEVQVRTVEMHRAAESGNAAHWRYRARKAMMS